MSPVPRLRWPLRAVIARLQENYGIPAPLAATDPFEMVLWENCAYLVDDARRAAVFARLRKATGLEPARIAAMRPAPLAELIAGGGGMRPPMRAANLRRAADLALDVGQGELRTLCRTDPRAARRILRKFPGIADPGAERILMVSGSVVALGLESNGVRVLFRLGFGTMQEDYPRMWRSVSAAVAAEVPATTAGRIRAHRLLRQHGRTLCKTAAPRCAGCPLRRRCPAAPTT
jgi:endonuclease III